MLPPARIAILAVVLIIVAAHSAGAVAQPGVTGDPRRDPGRPRRRAMPPEEPPPALPRRPTAPHPRVLIRPDELPMIRARCGLTPPVEIDGRRIEAATAQVAALQRLTRWMDRNADLPIDDGGLYIPAFLHLVTGVPGVPDRYTRCVERELGRREPYVVDYDDVVAALDWCWDALEPAAREGAAAALRDILENNRQQMLSPDVSPLEHYLFFPRLSELAAAIALRGDLPETSRPGQRNERVLEAAEKYFDDVLPRYVLPLCGRAPCTSLQPEFEADLTFALELWDVHTGGRCWPKFADAMAGSLDAYFYSETTYRGFFSALVHDFGSRSPAAPGEGRTALAAGVADVLARRTNSPVASWYADLVPPAIGREDVRQLNRLWMRILHADRRSPPADPIDAPPARNLGDGWVLMRSDFGPGATLVAFDAGQPLWLGRQHHDAGQFQILRKGRLALDSGDDVRQLADSAHGGSQMLGSSAGEFDRYAAATVAHNCMLIRDPRDRMRMAQADWPALGNQRRVSGDWSPRDGPIEAGERVTGRLVAFETNAHYSYALADLAKAYHVRSVLLYDRHLLFVGGRYLFVVDRVITDNADVDKTWTVHLPSRPRVGGRDLETQFRRRGTSDAAGVWSYSQLDDWIAADGGDGRLFVRTLLPQRRRCWLVGGPQTVERVAQGPMSGRSFVGSSAEGFEYWLTPAAVEGGKNAWYRLGHPNELGPAFGAGAGWGRLEVEPLDAAAEHLFVHLLVPDDRMAHAEPQIRIDYIENGVEVTAPGRGVEYRVTLTPRATPAGRVLVTQGERVVMDQTLAKAVEANGGMAVRMEHTNRR